MTPKYAFLSLCTCIALVLSGCARTPGPSSMPAPPAVDKAALARAQAQAKEASAHLAEVSEAAEAAYLYGYSLVTSEIVRLQMSNVAQITPEHAPANAFLNLRRFAPREPRSGSARDVDRLYSVAWLDLGAEPIVFSHPDMGKRYFAFELHSLWMPLIESVGSRTTGQKAQRFLVTGPGWQGRVPRGMQRISAPTRHVLIVGSTPVDGSAADARAVQALQAGFRLVPLSAHGKRFDYKAPPVDDATGISMTHPPAKVIDAMEVSAYFNLLARLLGEAAPPPAEDAAMLATMAGIGVVPGKPFDMSGLEPLVRSALARSPAAVRAKMLAHAQASGAPVNGWVIPTGSGVYGTDYLARAASARFDWPSALPQDQINPTARLDAKGRRLSGAHKYTLRFDKGGLPPVEGAWSLAMALDDGGDSGWREPNALERYNIGLRERPRFDRDGSLTLLIQREPPAAEHQANWLPAPLGEFVLTLQMLGPRAKPPSILPPGQGSWVPPSLRRVD